MGREFSECKTFSDADEDKPEPETEDFFNEVVENSLRKKKEYERQNKETKKRK